MPTDRLYRQTAARLPQLSRGILWGGALLGGILLAVPPFAGTALAQPAKPAAPAPAPAPPRPPRIGTPGDGSQIAAIVNGDVVSFGDIDARRRLQAVSIGLQPTPDVLDRLTPQVTKRLIDERLKLQEMQRRKIVVQDDEVAQSIVDLERRVNFPPGAIRNQLASVGLSLRTFIDQQRVQIGWSRLVREALGPTAEPTAADIAERAARMKSQIGQTEYAIGEIFIPISDPLQAADAQRFGELVIQQLRTGVPFAVVAAQFSQSQSALQGGDLGWVQASQLDDNVVKIANEMPVGAVSNPVRVPGGLEIVTLRGRREIGKDMAAVADIRQLVLPFPSALNPNAPTPEQRKIVEQMRALIASSKECAALDATAKATAGAKYTATADVRVDGITNPALRQLVATLPIGKPSTELVAQDGVAVIMVCARETKNVGIPSNKELSQQLFIERLELFSQQMLRGLQRRAVIDERS